MLFFFKQVTFYFTIGVQFKQAMKLLSCCIFLLAIGGFLLTGKFEGIFYSLK